MLTSLLGKSHGIEITPFGAGVAALTIVYAAYVAELVRGAVRNLPRGQFEAAAALVYQAAVRMAVRHPASGSSRLALPGLVEHLDDRTEGHRRWSRWPG